MLVEVGGSSLGIIRYQTSDTLINVSQGGIRESSWLIQLVKNEGNFVLGAGLGRTTGLCHGTRRTGAKTVFSAIFQYIVVSAHGRNGQNSQDTVNFIAKKSLNSGFQKVQ